MARTELTELVASAAHLAAPVFQTHGWEWAISVPKGAPSRTEVPTEATIALRLREMVADAASNPDEDGGVGGGRFMVSYEAEHEDNGPPHYRIFLELGSWQGPYPED